MRIWKEIYEFKDGNCAVCDGEDHLMLKQRPKFIGVMPARFIAKVRKWLFDKYYPYPPRLIHMLDKETKQKIFKRLLDKEYRKEVQYSIMTKQQKSRLFKNEVEIEELKQAIFLKNFSWKKKISFITKFIKKLEDENIKYAIQMNTKFKCQNIFISKADKRETMVKGII